MINNLFEYILSFLKSRLLPMILVFVVLFVVLINRIFNLQIINGESYLNDLSNSIKKTRSVAATRGRIFDRNGVLLAYNELAYSVKISDSGIYDSSKKKNPIINETIYKTINIIESHGDKITNDFPIIENENGEYEYTFTSETALLRFLRDTYGTKSINDLTDAQRNSTAKELMDYLCFDKDYGYGVSEEYPTHIKLEIVNLRRYMKANSYNRYMSFTIAYEASPTTVAAILENSAELVGVVIEEEYIRKYVDSVYISNILGYTGNISQSELDDNGNFEANDIIGKIGIEQTLESDLQGKKGTKNVYVDTFGRITEVIDETEPVTGNDVYLTIDIALQKKVYNEIEDKLVEILLSKIKSVERNVDDKYITYTSDGAGGTIVSDILIPIKSVYFGLINNNIISLNKIKQQETSVAAGVYNTFLNKQSQVIPEMNRELLNTPTVFEKLSEEKKSYIDYIEKMLKDNGIINKNVIDTTDDTYQNWYLGTISLQEYLTYAISKNWIDISKLTSEKYSSLQEGYNSLVDYISNKIQNDSKFDKLIYKYLIDSGVITGKQVCLMLYDQGVLAKNDAEYATLSAGSSNPYDFMMAKIASKQITPAQLALEPCSGSCVITNPKTGDVLALVSYPGYDNNKLSGSVDSDYYNQLNSDISKPLYDKATQSQTAPGSIFKLTSAIAGLEQGAVSLGEQIYCNGTFSLVTPSPRCWQLYGHGNLNVTTAIRDSCNIYFYNVGYRLALEPGGKYNTEKGTTTLRKYAEQLGLATKAGIEINEKEPQASNINSIASAIGQGTHNYSALNMVRYVSTIATSGINHNLTLVDKVTDLDGNLIRDNQAEIANTMDDVKDSTWNAVHAGMRLVIQTGSANYNVLPVAVAGKSGTAQENLKKPDHATFVSYAPYENPDVAMSVVIPNGYKSVNVAALTLEMYKIYYGLK